MNTTPDPTVYVDPCPGKKGTDHVPRPCSRCGGDGLYHGLTNATWKYKGMEAPWCFACGGSGQQAIKVSSARAAARRAANQARAWRDAAPLREWLTAKNAWEADVRAWLKAEKEHVRMSALVTGFVGDIGAKITNLTGNVTAAIEYDTTTFQGRDTTGRILVITLDDGHVVKWMSATAAGIWGYERGDHVRIVRAVVKDHSNFRGQDQTELKNVKLEDQQS